MKTLTKALITVVAVLVVAEGALRIQHRFQNPAEYYGQKVIGDFLNNIFKVIHKGKRPSFFHPPFVMFANHGHEDEGRLRTIFEKTLGPLGASGKTNDPLMPESREEFRISLNKLGFRGEDRSSVKARGTTRVIVLGSYQAWGLGVNDDETYPALLEKRLNEDSKKKYEVWNGGRMTATAIIGLAHLKHNVLKHDPDLVVLDYGFVDSMMLSRPVFLSGKPGPFLEMIHGLISYSHLLQRIRVKLWSPVDHSERLGSFSVVMDETLRILKANSIPVILVRQKTFTDTLDPFFDDARNSGVTVVSTKEIMEKNPLPLEAWKKTDWIQTAPAHLWEEVPLFTHAPYYKNPFQLNPSGHAIIAKELSRAVRKKIEDSSGPR